ncbi:unnamed protein product, partial [Didymodactylos carnosus]
MSCAISPIGETVQILGETTHDISPWRIVFWRNGFLPEKVIKQILFRG